MAHVAAAVLDAADTREIDCLLPDDVEAGSLALRLAEIAGFPLIGVDGYPVNYGLVVKSGRAIPPTATLKGLRFRAPLFMRLVPELLIGSDELDLGIQHPADEEEAVREPHIDIRILGEKQLVSDVTPESAPDIRIDASVYEEIAEFAAQDRKTECAGLLLGSLSTEHGQRILQISAIAPAADAVGNRTSVRMTIEAWESMLSIRDHEYPELSVLGWFHTHAGWGVFLSDSDVFTHRSYFGHSDMVAYVLDPTTGRDGFFHWRGRMLSLCPSYAVVGQQQAHHERRRGRRPNPVAGVIALVVIGGLVYGGASIPRVLRANHRPAPVVHRHRARPAPPRPADTIYQLGRGENLWIVSKRVYGDATLADALARYNGLTSVSGLQIGQEIKLPPEEVLVKQQADTQ